MSGQQYLADFSNKSRSNMQFQRTAFDQKHHKKNAIKGNIDNGPKDS